MLIMIQRIVSFSGEMIPVLGTQPKTIEETGFGSPRN